MIDFVTMIATLIAKYCPKLNDLHPEDNDRYTYNDQGNGYLFADFYKKIACYVADRRVWYVYNGKIWVADTGGLMAMELCKHLATLLCEYALSIPIETVRTNYLAFASSWQRRRCRETLLKDAAGVYSIKYQELDQHPLLLNCLNGTLDLRTKELHCHRPEDMMTMMSGVVYDPKARSPRWERFVSEVMSEDGAKVKYLQKIFGYSLTGSNEKECFFILYGPSSRNGKSTALETIVKLLGDYAKTATPDTVARKPSANGSQIWFLIVKPLLHAIAEQGLHIGDWGRCGKSYR